MTWEKLDKPKFFISLTGALIWLFAPFATINIFSFSDPPAASESLFSYPFYMDSIFEYPLFWISLLTGLPVFIGLITSFTNTQGITNFFAFFAIFAFVGYSVMIISEAGVFTGFTNLFGYGYWLLFIADFILLFVFRSNDTKYTADIPVCNNLVVTAAKGEPETEKIPDTIPINLDKTVEDYATNSLFINSQKPYIYTNEQNQKILVISNDNNAIIPKRPSKKLLNSTVNHSITES